MQTDQRGKGVINILAADKLMQSPEALCHVPALDACRALSRPFPRSGDPEKPKLVFFFDEAHLLFDDAPKALEDKIEQVVRLIRSKGVGVYFVTQNPLDIPETVLGQLGNRVQHALRAFTPQGPESGQGGRRDLSRQPRPGCGEGHHRARCGRGAGFRARRERHARPSVERALICPPRSRLTPLDDGRTQRRH